MDSYDVVIVGAGIAGPIIAKQLGTAGKRVLLLESGPAQPPTERQAYLDTFYKNSVKTPESPYPPMNGAVTGQPPPSAPSEQAVPRATVADTFSVNVNPAYTPPTGPPPPGDDSYIYTPDASYLLQRGPLPFLSTYERLAGGTTWHWLGTSLRFLEHDFTMESTYGVMRDWPVGVYDDLVATYYNQAESEIGVSADKATQESELGDIGLEYEPADYQYPMQGIPTSLVDDAIAQGLGDGTQFIDFEGLAVEVTPTPAGRNSQPRGQRRACAGNTNCIPICPIQAKYDGTVTLSDALQTGNVTMITQAVASKVNVDGDGNVSGIDYVQWDTDANGNVQRTGSGTAAGTVYVLAAHAIETPKLLLMSADETRPLLANGVGNSSGLVGANLMDHPLYLSWALMPEGKNVWGFRGPLTTAGIETLRDGTFRSERAAWRVEIGNEGWNFSSGDPWTTTLDFISGSNGGQLNPTGEILFGNSLVAQLNDAFTRQWRMGFLVEQTPDTTSRISLSKTLTDGLGLPRPVIDYNLSEYTRLGFAYAEIFARQVYLALGARCYTQNPQQQAVFDPTGKVVREVNNPAWFPMEKEWVSLFENLPPELKTPEVTNLPASANGIPEGFQYFGAGHLVGTYVMGDDPNTAVLDGDQRSWDHKNLFMVGSGVFPTITTANPTLTLAALAFRAADAIQKQLATA